MTRYMVLRRDGMLMVHAVWMTRYGRLRSEARVVVRNMNTLGRNPRYSARKIARRHKCAFLVVEKAA